MGEVGAGQLVERRPNVEGRFIPVAAGDPWRGQRGGGRLGRDGQGLQLGLDGGVAGGELCLTHVKELEILRQDEDVLVAVVAGERGGDLRRRGSAVRITVLGEDVWVAFAGDEGAEDQEPGAAGDVADHARQEEVHLDQRFLHPLDVGAGVLDERVPMAQQGAEGETGRKLPRRRPTLWSSRSHSQSWTSLLRPGTCLTWRALTSRTSSPRASRMS